MSELHKWLKGNLGPRCLAPLTSTDARALAAAVAIVELFGCEIYADDDGLAAFRTVVMRMQASTRHLAYHAIAMLLDWPDRAKLWALAGLPPQQFGKCKYNDVGDGLCPTCADSDEHPRQIDGRRGVSCRTCGRASAVYLDQCTDCRQLSTREDDRQFVYTWQEAI